MLTLRSTQKIQEKNIRKIRPLILTLLNMVNPAFNESQAPNDHQSQYFFFLFVTVLPVILPFSYDEIINVGDSLDLFCQISKGDRPMVIKWSFEGFNNNQGIEIKTKRISDKTSLLTIAEASAYHSGKYTCTASNQAGSVSFSTNITVNGT